MIGTLKPRCNKVLLEPANGIFIMGLGIYNERTYHGHERYEHTDQEQMARDLFVTRQAISRWETGETSPSIDMVKLICVTYSIPLERFFEMPAEYYCQCCSMPIPDEALHGTEADGSPSDHYCKWCYQEGDFTAKGVDMDEFIEATAQMEADAMGISREEAVSLMATLLPHLDRWKNEPKN